MHGAGYHAAMNEETTAVPLLSLAAGVLPEFPPDEIVNAAGVAGFPASGIWFDPETWTDATTERVRAALAAHRLVPLDIEVIWIRPGRAIADYAPRLIAAGGELGARNVLIVSVNPVLADTQHQFGELCELAAKAGMRAVLEFLMIGETKSLPQALEVVRGVGHPAGGVLIDALHLQRSGGRPEDLASVDPALLPYAQLCDAPADLAEHTYQSWLTDAVDGRSAPGEGELPLARLLDALPAHTPLSLEVRSRRYREQYVDPVARAGAVLAQTRRFFAELPSASARTPGALR
jgi:sugar phosphate isomerase/epimerase